MLIHSHCRLALGQSDTRLKMFMGQESLSLFRGALLWCLLHPHLVKVVNGGHGEKRGPFKMAPHTPDLSLSCTKTIWVDGPQGSQAQPPSQKGLACILTLTLGRYERWLLGKYNFFNQKMWEVISAVPLVWWKDIWDTRQRVCTTRPPLKRVFQLISLFFIKKVALNFFK